MNPDPKISLDNRRADSDEKVLRSAQELVNTLFEAGFVPQGATAITLNLNRGRIERRDRIQFTSHA